MASPYSRGDSPCGGLENAPAEPPALFPLVFLSGEIKGKKKQVFREQRGALPFPAAPTEAGSPRVGRGENRAATLSSSPGRCERSPRRQQPRAQRRELESLALGGTGGGASAHAHTKSRG